MSQPPTSVKLHYFDATGRANQIRLALAAGGVAFEDVKANYPPTPESKANWSKLTNGTTLFSVPILTIDEGTDNEQVYVQSSAILRKAGRMGDLQMTLLANNDNDNNNEDEDKAAYFTDRAIADADDLRTSSYGGMLMFGASKEKSDTFVTTKLPAAVACFEKQLVAEGGDFFGGSSTISLADIAIYDAVVFFGRNLVVGAEGVEDPFCGGDSAMSAWVKRVESNERVQKYFESDQYKAIAMKFDKSAVGY